MVKYECERKAVFNDLKERKKGTSDADRVS